MKCSSVSADFRCWPLGSGKKRVKKKGYKYIYTFILFIFWTPVVLTREKVLPSRLIYIQGGILKYIRSWITCGILHLKISITRKSIVLFINLSMKQKLKFYFVIITCYSFSNFPFSCFEMTVWHFSNSADPNQTAPIGAVWFGSSLFACKTWNEYIIFPKQ